MSIRGLCSLLLVGTLSVVAFSQDVVAQLKAIPRVIAVQEMGGTRYKAYTIIFEQPVDHKNPNGPKFEQYLYISHSGFDKPNILETEGYSKRGPYGGELRRMLPDSNSIAVEHRYFGRSMPSPVVWEHLTIKNAADDMHDIVTALKTVYKGKWISTGASKGGQTALFYKSYYPNDVDATVAYVAPINIGQEDPRINGFMETVGDAETRKKVKEFQIALLKREDEIIPLLDADPKKFSMGVAKAYEYGVLEFPYALWQYGSNKTPIPAPNAPAADLVAMYKLVNAMYYYSDAGIRQFQAFYYQAFSEIGYYNYDITDLKPYLKANPNPTNMDLCPAETRGKIVYNPATLAFVFNFLQYKAQNIVFIYGETDAWSSTQMHLIGRTNAIKIMVKGAWHNASVDLASPEQKDLFYSTMNKWLGLTLNRR